MKQHTLESIKNDLDLITGLLTVGVDNVAEMPSTREAIIMRTARQLAIGLYLIIDRLSKKEI